MARVIAIENRTLTMTLPEAFHSPPTLAQFACNGRWEDALAFTQTTVPSVERLHAYLQGRTEVAFESFHHDHFLGVRYEGTADHVLQFAWQCVRGFEQACLGKPISTALQQALGQALFATPAAFAEVGAVNAWRSVGALRVELSEASCIDFEALWEAITHSPVGKDRLHPKALEFAFSTPISHWVGIPISDPDPGHAISPTRLAHALRTQGITIGS